MLRGLPRARMPNWLHKMHVAYTYPQVLPLLYTVPNHQQLMAQPVQAANFNAAAAAQAAQQQQEQLCSTLLMTISCGLVLVQFNMRMMWLMLLLGQLDWGAYVRFANNMLDEFELPQQVLELIYLDLTNNTYRRSRDGYLRSKEMTERQWGAQPPTLRAWLSELMAHSPRPHQGMVQGCVQFVFSQGFAAPGMENIIDKTAALVQYIHSMADILHHERNTLVQIGGGMNMMANQLMMRNPTRFDPLFTIDQIMDLTNDTLVYAPTQQLRQQQQQQQQQPPQQQQQPPQPMGRLVLNNAQRRQRQDEDDVETNDDDE